MPLKTCDPLLLEVLSSNPNTLNQLIHFLPRLLTVVENLTGLIRKISDYM